MEQQLLKPKDQDPQNFYSEKNMKSNLWIGIDRRTGRQVGWTLKMLGTGAKQHHKMAEIQPFSFLPLLSIVSEMEGPNW